MSGASREDGSPERRDGLGRLVLVAIGLLSLARRPEQSTSASAVAGHQGGAPESTAPERPYTVSGTEEPPRWRSRWAFYAVGAAMMAWGLYGLLSTASTKPLNWASFFLGGVVAHDLVFAPLLALVAVLALQHIPAPYRSYVQAGVLLTGLLTLVTLPMLVSPGRPDDPSTLPLPYGRNLLLVLAVVWATVLLTAVVGRQRSRRQPRTVIE